MNNIKNVFSIKDLENLSGIKAHTIRMWEKRYGILAPERTDTNIRNYSTASLQKLLNVTLLNRHGYKISKIATLDESEIPILVREIISDKNAPHHAMNAFKLSMMNFDQGLFFRTYDELLAERPLHTIFFEVIIPFLEHIGFLWQTGTITPAHEHFISNLIRQKIATMTESEQKKSPVTDRTFILFLPEGELHELGLMYIHYEILRNGHRSIYLGEDVPISNLSDVERYFDNITYISYFTVSPPTESAENYVHKITERFVKPAELWLIGQNTRDMRESGTKTRIRLFNSIQSLCKEL